MRKLLLCMIATFGVSSLAASMPHRFGSGTISNITFKSYWANDPNMSSTVMVEVRHDSPTPKVLGCAPNHFYVHAKETVMISALLSAKSTGSRITVEVDNEASLKKGGVYCRAVSITLN